MKEYKIFEYKFNETDIEVISSYVSTINKKTKELYKEETGNETGLCTLADCFKLIEKAIEEIEQNYAEDELKIINKYKDCLGKDKPSLRKTKKMFILNCLDLGSTCALVALFNIPIFVIVLISAIIALGFSITAYYYFNTKAYNKLIKHVETAAANK